CCYCLVHLPRLHITSFSVFSFPWYGDHRNLHSFPTRRSSDLIQQATRGLAVAIFQAVREKCFHAKMVRQRAKNVFQQLPNQHDLDRKSTRLNSSHVKISYAVFCLKKKKKTDRVSTVAQATHQV